jgi:hypothetical protein
MAAAMSERAVMPLFEEVLRSFSYDSKIGIHGIWLSEGGALSGRVVILAGQGHAGKPG